MSIVDDLVALRSTYPPRLSPQQAVELLNRFALQHQALGFGLYRAPDGGNGSPLPNGIRVRCDILATKDPEAMRIYDVLKDGPDSTADPVYHGVSEIVWQDKGPIDLNRWVAPVPNVGEIPPTPGTPPPVDFSAIMAKLIDLDDAYRALRVEHTLLRTLVTEVHKRQDRILRGRLGINLALEPEK